MILIILIIDNFNNIERDYSELAKCLIPALQFCEYPNSDEADQRLEVDREYLTRKLKAYCEGKLHVSREALIACMLLANVIAEEKINDVLVECGYHRLSTQIMFDVLVYDAINNADKNIKNTLAEKSAFSRLCRNVQIYMKPE